MADYYEDLFIYETITLLNPNPTPASIEIIALDRNGYEIDRAPDHSLSSWESNTISLVDIFGPEVLKDLSMVRVVSDTNIAGIQLVDYPEVDLVGLPALTIASKGWLFPIAMEGGNLELWTRIGIINPGSEIAEINVEAFDAGNNSLGVIEKHSLLPGALYFTGTDNTNTDGGVIPLNSAYIKVTADRPVSGYEVIGVVNGSGLTAVMGIPEEDLTPVGFEITGSNDGDILNVYSMVRMGDESVRSTVGSLENGEWKKEMELSMLSMQGTRDIIQNHSMQESATATTTLAPNAPSNLTATILNNTSIALYWHDNSEVEKGFKIERKMGNENWIQIRTTTSNSSLFDNNYYVDSKLDNNNNTYYYRIRAYNDNGNSNYSNETLAVSIETSNGFDFPVGNANGDGSYIRHDNNQECTMKIDGYSWYVASDIMDPNYVFRGKLQWHTGEDWNGACYGDTDRNQPVYATSLGRVVYAGYIPKGWGNVVLVAHRLPTGEIIYTQYAHLERIDVSSGIQVNRRQPIGTIGKGPENKYPAHLHFEVRRIAVGVGNWPNDPEKIKEQYYDPTDRKRDNDNKWNQAGFIESHRNLNGTDNPPSISITSPNNGATVSGVVTITADATDDKGITKVEFYLDGIYKSTDTSFPYSWSWDTTQSNNGSHTIKAVAYDTANQTATNQISVTVKNISTSITVTIPNGGENWQAGSTQKIAWTYKGDPGPSVKIVLLKGNSDNRTITSSTSIGSNGSGFYNWTIPLTQTTGNDYKVRVTSTSNSSYTDTSDNNFTISTCLLPGSFTLTATPGCDGSSPYIQLNWTASSGATAYDVYRNGSLYYSNSVGTQYIDSSNITSGMTYTYYVTAKNACGLTNSNTISEIALNCGSQPNLKLPLSGNKSWLLTVEAGGKDFWGGTDIYHTGNGYYSLDFDDYTKEDRSLIDVPILAAGNGQVIESGWSSGGFGYTVLIDHDEPYDGNGYATRYGHLKETPPVSAGQKVKQGDVVGIMGSTGDSTGTHVHFQVYYNKSSASTVEGLQGLIIDGTKIEDYKVGTQNPWNPKYYLSTNIRDSILEAPTLLSATPKCDGTTPGIELQWTAVSGATNYEVYRNGVLIYTTASNGTTFWNTVGLTSGQSYTYQVKAKNNSTTSNFSNSLTAVAPNCGSTEVIVDDQSSDFTKYGTSSYWHEASIGYNSHMFWTYNNQWTIDNYAIWQPNLSNGGAGTYVVYVYIPNNYATTTNATYTVFHNGITDTRTVNQAIYFNQWVSLGSFYFSANGNEYVQLVDKTGEAAITKMIGFDAVKWVKQ